MRRWDQRLARLIRVLIACLALSLAAPGSAVAVEPLRDVSAWLAGARAASAATVAAEPAARAAHAQRAPAELGAARPAEHRASFRSPPAARARADRRYLYLELQTLRC